MLKNKLLDAIAKDEREYCFDRSYHSDEFWEDHSPNETREDAYNRVMTFWKSVNESEFVDKVKEYFDDKYNYIIDEIK